MRIVVVGLNERALQRQNIAGADCVALTRSVHEIPLENFDAVIICTTIENKYAVARYALSNKKHVMFEAPLWGANLGQFEELEQLAIANKVGFYIAYSLRLVPEFDALQQNLQSKQLGEIYHCRLTYAAHVDQNENGALIDLVPHLLNLLGFWFGSEIMQKNFNIAHKDKFGRHVICADFNSRNTVELEANFFAPRDQLSVVIYGSRDMIEINYAYTEEQRRALQQTEYQYFLQQCSQTQQGTDLVMDKWIFAEIDRLASEEMLLA